MISVITPVLNGAKYLDECIQSVLSQNYLFIEHIFVDGGSTDGTLGILASYQAKYPNRIRFITEQDKSPTEAWTKGMVMAKGEILGWLGSDDIYEPNAIQTVMDFFRVNPTAFFVFGGCNYIDEKGKVIKRFLGQDFKLEQAINDACHIPCPSAFYRREVISRVGLDSIVELNGELDFWISVGERFQIYHIEKILSNFRVHNAKRYNSQSQKEFYNFAHTSFMVGRRHGASMFSPCGRRYLLALATYPLHIFLVPLFHFMSTGDANRWRFWVIATRPLHPILAFLYRLIVGKVK